MLSQYHSNNLSHPNCRTYEVIRINCASESRENGGWHHQVAVGHCKCWFHLWRRKFINACIRYFSSVVINCNLNVDWEMKICYLRVTYTRIICLIDKSFCKAKSPVPGQRRLVRFLLVYLWHTDILSMDFHMP